MKLVIVGERRVGGIVTRQKRVLCIWMMTVLIVAAGIISSAMAQDGQRISVTRSSSPQIDQPSTWIVENIEVNATDFGTAEDCVNPEATCIPSGLVTLTNTVTGTGNCSFTANISWGDGSSESHTFTSDITFQHQYASSGLYTVQITGSGTPLDANSTCTFNPFTHTYEVPTPNHAPIATFVITSIDGLAVSFDASDSTDPDDDPIETFVWDFGDGTLGNGVNPTHRYAIPSTYRVTLTVFDARGNQSEPVSSFVTVEESVGWDRLLDRAEMQYELALGKYGTAVGFYHQILNLLCAAAQSTRPVCEPMFPYYRVDDPDWAGPWVFEVFDNYLGDSNPTKDEAELTIVQTLVDAGRETANQICQNLRALDRTIDTLCHFRQQLSTAGDEGALIAGTLHFWYQLEPAFLEVTEQTIRTLPADVDEQTLKLVLDDIRAQHEALFENAVRPGFEVVAGSEQISVLGKIIARLSVPLFAQEYREGSIKEALMRVYGEEDGKRLYGKTR